MKKKFAMALSEARTIAITPDDVELVVDHRDQPGDRVERPDDDQNGRPKHDSAGRPSGDRLSRLSSWLGSLFCCHVGPPSCVVLTRRWRPTRRRAAARPP